MKHGVLYIATGHRYIAEAAKSVASLKSHMPDLATAIFCDDVALASGKQFDIVEPLVSVTYSFLDRFLAFRRSPFENTLFLDSDTLVIQPIGELFELLDGFDLAAAHAPWRWVQPSNGCPECFPELNCGVILYRRRPEVLRLFTRWEAIYRAQLAGPKKPRHDQPAFRQALYESDLRFTILPPEYNLRTPFPAFAGGNAKVKILHGRGPSLERLRRIVNQKRGPRVFAGGLRVDGGEW